MIRVLVVEDSAVNRQMLVHLLSADPEIQVVGTAADGVEAVAAVERDQPDAITMDINMPKMNGFEATRAIMETRPTPIVIVSGSHDPHEVAVTFKAMEAGALAVLAKPPGFGHPDFETSTSEIVRTVKLMSEVKLVRRRPKPPRSDSVPSAPSIERSIRTVRLVAVGASTGGPVILQTLLSRLPEDFPVPVVVVQHMAAGFVEGFAEWLGQSSRRPVLVAKNGQHAMPASVYLAPDGAQMRIDGAGTIRLADDPPENGLRPSVSYLFRSVALAYRDEATAVLLTGMGQDGADELKLIRDSGAVTFVQDEATSIVFGMPGEAIKRGGATHVLPPAEIADALVRLVGR